MPATLPNTLHFKLAQTLREQVKRLKPGDLLPTQRELRQQFNVSQVTLERALMRLQREGLIHRPAGKQRLVRSEVCDPALHRIAIVRPDWPSAVYDGVAQAIVKAGRTRDWAFDLIHYRSEEGLDLTQAVGINDAAVFMPTSEPLPDHLRVALGRPRKPVVIVQDQFEGVAVSSVCSDDARMAGLAVEHLVGLGHRRIAALVPTLATHPMRSCVEGWRSAIRTLNVDDEESLLVQGRTKPFERSMDTAYRAFSEWLRTEASRGCTAVFCATHEMSMAALRALRERGLAVPRDFSVVGSDGIAGLGPYLVPPLTTVNLDMAAYGETVVSLLEQRLREPESPIRKALLEPYLIVRESTAPASV